MFELSVAFKYLIPRWRQLSVSIISIISILVISLVVWLIVVFFSVTHGLEKIWTDKLIALTAPIRIIPTKNYYASYYYLIDSISEQSDFTTKSIGEKQASNIVDPYSPESDQEIPSFWPNPDKTSQGDVKDLVKLAFSSLQSIEGVSAIDYETTVGQLKLNLLRNSFLHFSKESSSEQQTLTQGTYLTNYDPTNPYLKRTLLPLTQKDQLNLLAMAGGSGEYPPKEMQARLKHCFEAFRIASLKTHRSGWQISLKDLPETCEFAVGVQKNEKGSIQTLFLPSQKTSVKTDSNTSPASLVRHEGKSTLLLQDSKIPLAVDTPILVEGMTETTKLSPPFIDRASIPQEIFFDAALSIQETPLTAKAFLGTWEIGELDSLETQNRPLWFSQKQPLPANLPSDPFWGDALFLPKSWKEAGALIGDKGDLIYQAVSPSALQEMRIPVYVAGFFDPGILPMGGRMVLASDQLISTIRSVHSNESMNGINVRFDDVEKAEEIKGKILAAFEKEGIAPYWKVETYREFEFTKDFLQQLRSDRNLFSLIAIVIIIVACSNIVSMLIILVNDKKTEIGILRSMGATSQSIAAIFGLSGIVMGLLGSLIGIGLALFTLRYLQVLIDLISRVQGFELFNPSFFGESLPTEVSFEALGFVLTATILLSLIAGVVPAIKACLLPPSAILRAE